jgi:hypothetical protein
MQLLNDDGRARFSMNRLTTCLTEPPEWHDCNKHLSILWWSIDLLNYKLNYEDKITKLLDANLLIIVHDLHLEGQQPHCLNSYEGQVWIANKKGLALWMDSGPIRKFNHTRVGSRPLKPLQLPLTPIVNDAVHSVSGELHAAHVLVVSVQGGSSIGLRSLGCQCESQLWRTRVLRRCVDGPSLSMLVNMLCMQLWSAHMLGIKQQFIDCLEIGRHTNIRIQKNAGLDLQFWCVWLADWLVTADFFGFE